MTDMELKEIAEMIDDHASEISELVQRILESGREDRFNIIFDLSNNYIPIIASAVDIMDEYYNKKQQPE
jgi:hypothetical protein